MKRIIVTLLLSVVVLLVVAVPTQAAPAITGHRLYLNGMLVSTVVVSSPLPRGGLDPLYAVTNGVPDQQGVAGVGPGHLHASRSDIMRVDRGRPLAGRAPRPS